MVQLRNQTNVSESFAQIKHDIYLLQAQAFHPTFCPLALEKNWKLQDKIVGRMSRFEHTKVNSGHVIMYNEILHDPNCNH